ncbi:MAG: Hsp20/alpha crystallin family protein, partial [Haloarculaceae archaeon]
GSARSRTLGPTGSFLFGGGEPPDGTMTRHTPQHEVELYREEDSYVVIVELPGANADDVDVNWVDGHLSIAAEVETDGRRHVVSRRLSVPKEIDPSGISASFEDGVLEVTLPIVGETRPDGIRIEVESGSE